MRIDFASLAFGYKVLAGGNTPNWATSLGQGKEYKINDNYDIDEVVKGMVYSSVSLNKISTKIGKGGNLVKGNENSSPIVLGSVFSKVYANENKIKDAKFVLLITRDTSKHHEGRLRLKYGPSNTYEEDGFVYTNSDFFTALKEQLNLADDACWFVSDITIKNQDELILKTHIVNAEGAVEYDDSKDLHAAWDAIAPYDGDDNHSGTVADNILFYGVPGCGKSHTIKRDYCDDELYMERVVFHPDYTYSDFVGQIIPKISLSNEGKKNISYEFEAGPFTRILEKAENNSGDYYLIIEEINRGNAPAIFGDIFQLLDRDESGNSEYGISNEDIAEYVYGDKNAKVRIPSNLYILATMNTSDQNVFTLDTAFKRRWTMKHIENDIDACKFADHDVCGNGVSWSVFANTINDMIIEVATENLSNEDNRLGAYFVKESELDDADKFGEKVLMYLWNDVFRYDHEKIFKTSYHTLDELISGFKESGLDVFVDKDRFAMKPDFIVGGKLVEVDKYLENKKQHLVLYYNALRDMVKGRVPDIREASTKSLQYASWRSENITKSSFADIQFQSDKLLIFTETPQNQDYQDVGTVIPKDGHHNHYYKIIYDDSVVDKIVEIIVDSYVQLKKKEVDANA